MGRSTPSTVVESIAPTATSNASVSRMKVWFDCGYARVTVSARARLKRSKACWASGDQLKRTPFLVSFESGSAMLAKFLTN